jgi:hypothetical protein
MRAKTRALERLLWGSIAIAGAGVLLVLILLWLGFRAVQPPSAFETVVARRVRDLAIPWGERRAKNPLAGDAAALQQGHERLVMR